MNPTKLIKTGLVFILCIQQSISFADKTWVIGKNEKNQIWVSQNNPETIQVLSSESSLNHPSLTRDPLGNPWAFWSQKDDTAFTIYYSLFKNNQWDPARPIEISDQRWDNNPQAIFDIHNNGWLVWSWDDGTDEEIVYSFYNGHSWSTKQRVHDNNQIPDTYPTIAIDDNQTPIIVWAQLNKSEHRYELLFTTWQLNQWSQPQEVHLDATAGDLYANFMKDAQGQLFLCWATYDHFYQAKWNGLNFEMSQEISYPELMNSLIQSPPQEDWSQILIENTAISSLLFYFEPLDGNNSMPGQGWTATNSPYSIDGYIAFGDSISDGFGSTDGNGYRVRLQNLLEAQYGQATVINRGVGRETSARGLGRIDSVLSSDDAKYILLMEGTNDHDEADATVADNIEQMAIKSINSSRVPLVATIIPENTDYNSNVAYINSKIRSMANSNDYYFVDIEQIFYNTGNYTAYLDGAFHPNNSGYQLMAESWFDELLTVKAIEDKESIKIIMTPPEFYTSSTADYNINAYQLENTTSDTITLVTSVDIPANSTIKKMWLFAYDNASGENELITAQLLYYKTTDQSDNHLVSSLTTDNSATNPQKQIASNISQEVTNNQFYYLKITIPSSSSTALKFYRIQIKYETS